MAMSHPMLQKKLQELETLLHDVASLAPEELAHRKHNISRDIELRVIFLKTLTAAEISSSPETPELAVIAGRLTELEDAFHRWKSFEDPLSETEAEDEESLGVFNGESVSTCSCTESCFNMNGDVKEGNAEAEKEEEEYGEERETECNVRGREKACLIRVLAFGFVVFVSFGLLGGFQHVEDDFGLMPT